MRSTAEKRSLREELSGNQRKEWWLWAVAFCITFLLTSAIVVLALPTINSFQVHADSGALQQTLRGLVALVILFDLYTIYQQVLMYRMRRRLIKREELFRLISENAADMIAVVSATGDRLYNSPSYERVLGYTPEELKKTSSLEQLHPDDREKVILAAQVARNTGVGQSAEYRMKHKNGTWRILESTASTVLDSNGQVEKVIVVNRDVTERRQLEKQLVQVQKMEAVGRLSGGVAHDFNNLLGVIIGYGEILEDSLRENPALAESVDQILKAGRQAASLTRQLLAFSRQQVLEPKVVDINEIVQETEKMLRRLIGEDILLATRLGKDLGKVKVDPAQLGQVVMNLAVNARDAMPNGGHLLIETENYEITPEFVGQHSYPVKAGDYVRLTVKDDGIGMSPEIQARIFDPFFTTKEKGKGTGLGLAMVYGLVKQSEGYIDVHSEVGVGTVLDIFLPRVEGTAKPSTGEKRSQTVEGGSETILLVEDEAGLRKLTHSILEARGYHVLEAENADAAMKVSNDFKAQIDLLLTDVVMPGMSGQILAERLRTDRPSVAVVFMSGYAGLNVGASGVLGEGSFFLPKPFSRDALTSKIREALSAQTGRIEGPKLPREINSPN